MLEMHFIVYVQYMYIVYKYISYIYIYIYRERERERGERERVIIFPVCAYHNTKCQDLENTFHSENNSEHCVEVF